MKITLIALAFSLNLSFAWAQPVPFTLKNNSLKAIYLEIPGVMNPNLSPMSNSGVELEEGQMIYFFHEEERYLLLKVTEDLKDQKVKVKSLIKKRKRELGLK